MITSKWILVIGDFRYHIRKMNVLWIYSCNKHFIEKLNSAWFCLVLYPISGQWTLKGNGIFSTDSFSLKNLTWKWIDTKAYPEGDCTVKSCTQMKRVANVQRELYFQWPKVESIAQIMSSVCIVNTNQATLNVARKLTSWSECMLCNVWVGASRPYSSIVIW